MTAAAAGSGLVTIGQTAAAAPANRALEAAGWERRFLADELRAREAVELYESLGYEVRAQQLEPADFGPQCDECAAAVCRSYVLIYTRRPEPAGELQP